MQTACHENVEFDADQDGLPEPTTPNHETKATLHATPDSNSEFWEGTFGWTRLVPSWRAFDPGIRMTGAMHYWIFRRSAAIRKLGSRALKRFDLHQVSAFKLLWTLKTYWTKAPSQKCAEVDLKYFGSPWEVKGRLAMAHLAGIGFFDPMPDSDWRTQNFLSRIGFQNLRCFERWNL